MKKPLIILSFLLSFALSYASEQTCISAFGARQFPSSIAEDALGKSHF